MQPLESFKNGLRALEQARKAKYRIKTGPNTYEIFHFETEADQVITNANKQFVSSTEKTTWNDKYAKFEIDEKVTTLNGKITTLQEADIAIEGRLTKAETNIVGKAPISHNHDMVNINGLQSALDTKETVANVTTKVGNAKQEAITSAASDATTKANSSLTKAKAYADTKKTEAVTESKTYTDGKITDLVGAAPAALDTLYEIATVLGNNTVTEDIVTQIGKKVDTTQYTTDKNNITSRLNTIESPDPLVAGSLSKTLSDAKSYTNAEIKKITDIAGGDLSTLVSDISSMKDPLVPGSLANKIQTNETNIATEKSRVDILTGADTVAGSVAKALKDAKADASAKDSTLKQELNAAIDKKADAIATTDALTLKADKATTYLKTETYSQSQVNDKFLNYLYVGSSIPTGSTIWIEINPIV